MYITYVSRHIFNEPILLFIDYSYVYYLHKNYITIAVFSILILVTFLWKF